MATYESGLHYIEEPSDIQCRVSRVDQVINALMSKMLESATNANYKEYQLDDGQTKIRTVYSSVEDIQKSIYALERYKQMLINQSNGRVMRLRHNHYRHC